MKCTRCKAPAAVELRQHNAGFCRACFIFYFQRQVQRAIEKEQMFAHEEAVLVAVSGGKDSLALWDVLIELGYQTTGLHLSLGIGAYSDQSTAKTVAFASARDLPLITVPLADEGLAVPEIASLTRRPACSACGTMKRHYFDQLADRPRLSGRRHRPQPRRRGGAAARQRAALADGAPGAPAARCSSRRTSASCAR